MITDGGGVNDKSFNQSAWEGLQQLNKDTGIKVKYLESKGDADFEPNLNQLIKGGYDLTWGIGFLMNKALTNVAKQNPDAKLASIDSVVDAPNVESVLFAENEGSFLVGVVAGLTTKTNKVGFVGGIEGDLIRKFQAGFAAGVKAVNPNAEVIVNYVGDFTKPDLGKTAAATIYNTAQTSSTTQQAAAATASSPKRRIASAKVKKYGLSALIRINRSSSATMLR